MGLRLKAFRSCFALDDVGYAIRMGRGDSTTNDARREECVMATYEDVFLVKTIYSLPLRRKT
jgi:hypothetical protein